MYLRAIAIPCKFMQSQYAFLVLDVTHCGIINGITILLITYLCEKNACFRVSFKIVGIDFVSSSVVGFFFEI